MNIAVEVMPLGEVRLPEWHPRAADGTCSMNGYAVRHPDGVIVFDTGTADDHPLINELYSPTVVPIVDALHRVGIDERDVAAIVNSHLHFDHCGQNRFLPDATVWAQRAEVAMIDEPRFTVPDWAEIDEARLRSLGGDEEIAPGVTILSTPGHTPGHQALLVEADGRRVLLAGQVCYSCAEFVSAEIDPRDSHGEDWVAATRESLARLRSLDADVVHLCHDPDPLVREAHTPDAN